MQLRRVEIIEYRNFKNVVIDFEKSEFPNVFSIASKNGGGKSTLLQFIFIMLYCFMDNEKKQYIVNLLADFSDITKDMKLVKFIIEEDNQEYILDFSISLAKKEEKNFDLYLDLKDTEEKIRELKKEIDKYKELFDLQKEMETSIRITPIVESNIRYLRKHISSNIEDKLYRQAKDKNDINLYKELLDRIISKINLSHNKLPQLEEIENRIQNDMNILSSELEETNIRYITHLKDDKNILLLESYISEEILVKLSNSIYLNAPSTQVFHFLSSQEKEEIFNDNIYYFRNIEKAKNNLEGFHTYKFIPTEIILEAVKKAFSDDDDMELETGHRSDKYQFLAKELKNLLDNKIIYIKKINGERKVIFEFTDTKKEVFAEDLSHGELKKLGIYIWLKHIIQKDAIILMDEVDIALHPKWQYELVDDLTKWSSKSQFLLATHSPQILSSTYYKNLIFLEKQENQTVVKQPNEMFTDNDINTIINFGMDATHIPPKLAKLQFEYRKLVENNQKDSIEGKKLESEILEWETSDSAFFQRIKMYLRFNK